MPGSEEWVWDTCYHSRDYTDASFGTQVLQALTRICGSIVWKQSCYIFRRVKLEVHSRRPLIELPQCYSSLSHVSCRLMCDTVVSERTIYPRALTSLSHTSLFTLHSSDAPLLRHSLTVEAFAVAGQLRQQLSHDGVAVHRIKRASLRPTSLALINPRSSSPALTPTSDNPNPPKPNPTRPNMPTTWTAERDQRLLLLLVEQVKVNGDAVAAAWKTKYGE